MTIFEIIVNKDLEAVKSVLAANAGAVNATTLTDRTPLHMAVASGDMTIVQLLLREGS